MVGALVNTSCFDLELSFWLCCLLDGSKIQRITLDSHVSALVDLWKRQKRAATTQVHEFLARQDPRGVAKPLVDM